MLKVGRPIAVAATASCVLSLVLCAAAFAKPSGAFSSKPAVKSLDVTCVTRGALRGRVIVDVRVRYGDARSASRFAGGRHVVNSSLKLRSLGGALLARDRDRGSAQVDIPGVKTYVHAHRHIVSGPDSKAVLSGRECGKGTRPVIRAKTRVTQTLSAGQRRAVAAAPSSQSASGVTTASVDPTANPGTALNGCILVGSDFNCHGVDLSGENLSGLSIAYGDFSFANLKNANLQDTRMGHVIMNQTILDDANMKGAQFGVASMTAASFLATDLEGAVGIFANLANAKFGAANLQGVDLGGANLVGTVFDNSGCDANTKFPAAFPHQCVNGLITG
jgi:uncharacterized protein YjbI with pentapeptide repeats